MDTTRRLWLGLAALMIAGFGVLLWMGWDIHLQAPPVPERVVTRQGEVVYTRADIEEGRRVWQSIGGQQLGSIWGHGALVAPDWSADWLHREAEAMLELGSRADTGMAYAQLDPAGQAAEQSRLRPLMRANTYDPASGDLVVDDRRAQAITQVAAHYESLFSNDPATAKLREGYAMREDTIPDASHRHVLTAFFFWSSWASAADRPGEENLSYTSNWPHEPLVGNTPTTGAGVWSIASVILMIAAIAGMIFYHSTEKEEDDPEPPKADPLFSLKPTPSMKATRKYFFVVIGLILAQVGMGAITAHYAVEGESFFGIPLAQILPFSVSRTIHTQFAVLWIATAWLATGLYIAPAISGHEPKYQKLGVDVLFYALLFIVVGSTAGGWLGTLQHQGTDFSFWIGNQGLEFTSMGRFWQILLFVGLLFWVTLLGRGLVPRCASRPKAAA